MSYLTLEKKNPFRIVMGIESLLAQANSLAIDWHHQDYLLREGFLNSNRAQAQLCFKACREKVEEMKILIDEYLEDTKDAVK